MCGFGNAATQCQGKSRGKRKKTVVRGTWPQRYRTLPRLRYKVTVPRHVARKPLSCSLCSPPSIRGGLPTNLAGVRLMRRKLQAQRNACSMYYIGNLQRNPVVGMPRAEKVGSLS